MIYDIFTYNGEADILEIRLNILDEYVDQFIIVEATTTFSGNKKPLYYKAQKARFKKWKKKIKYFVIDDEYDPEIIALADRSPNVPANGPSHWKREFCQKESIKKALTHLEPDDICVISDVDEIWNPQTAEKTLLGDFDVLKLRQIVYSYYLNNRSSEPWAGPVVAKYLVVRISCLNHLRTRFTHKLIDNSGWHFTSMGGLDEVRRKLNDSYTAESYNTPDVQAKLAERFGTSDYIGRSGFTFTVDESEWPQYLKDNREKYVHLLR